MTYLDPTFLGLFYLMMIFQPSDRMYSNEAAALAACHVGDSLGQNQRKIHNNVFLVFSLAYAISLAPQSALFPPNVGYAASLASDYAILRRRFDPPTAGRATAASQPPAAPGFAYVIGNKMASAQDPFYIVKEEIHESIDKLQTTFHQWERTSSSTPEYAQLTRELIASCESIQWQVDELDKANVVAARDPTYYQIDEVELGKRRRWTTNAHNQVGIVRKAVEAGNQSSSLRSTTNGNHRELMRLPNSHASEGIKSRHYVAQDNDDFISSESDRQLLLIRRQDEELDELSASVVRIGGVGLTIHDELIGQDRILEDLNMEMEATSNRLDFVQKKVATVMKKAGAKGQIMMIAFLIVLFIVLFILVFFT